MIKRPRIIYNDDTCGLRIITPPHTEEKISTAVDYMKNSQVDCVCWCLSTGDVALAYYSNILENMYDLVENDRDYIPARKSIDKDLIRSLHKKGIDYLPVLINKFHDAEISFYATFRMNDAHLKSRPNGSLSSEFWKNHQDYRLWEVQDGRSYYNATLDFSYPEIRKSRIDSIIEVVTRYDVDGIELDFCRNPYIFQPSEAWGKRNVLTKFILSIRNKINEIGRRKKKEIKLIIRVPFADEKLKQAGMDVQTWLEMGCLDILVMSNLVNDYNEKIAPWLELCRKNNILFYPSIEAGAQINCCPSVDLPPGIAAPKSNFYVKEDSQLSIKRVRGMAQSYNAQNPDGIYMFNYPCKLFETERNPDEFAELTSVLSELGSLETLNDKPKQYLFWGDLPIYVEAMRPPEYYQTIKFNIMDSNLNKTSKVVLSYIRAIEDNPHNIDKSKGYLPDNYIKTILNGKILDEKTFKKNKEKPGTIFSGFTIGEHEKIEIQLSGDDLLYGENSLAFHIPHFPENDSPYVYIYELCVETSSGQK